MLDRDYDMELDHIDFLLHVNEEEGETHLDSSTKVHLGGLLLFRAVEKKARKRERKDSSTKVHLDGLLLFRAVEKNARKRERKDSSTKVHLQTPK